MWGALVLYVGKTIRPLNKRAIEHRCLKKNGTSSRYIPDYMEWEIKLLEECPDDQGTTREQFWYDTLMPLYNYQRPGQDWEAEHPEYYRAYKRDWRIRNIEKCREYNRVNRREYREAKREQINAQRRERYAAKKAASKQNALVVFSGQSDREPQ